MGENQLGKRNLTDGQRIEIALQMEPLIYEQGVENRIRKPANFVPKISAEQNRSQNESRERVAKLAGVSHDTVKKYKELKETAPPEVLKEVLDGKKKIKFGNQQNLFVRYLHTRYRQMEKKGPPISAEG